VDNQKQFNLWLRGYAKAYWAQILFVSMLSLASIGFQLLNPWPIKILIDSVFGSIPAPGPLAQFNDAGQLLVVITALLIVIYLAQNIFTVLSGYVVARLDLRFDIQVRSHTFEKVMNMSLAMFNKKELGDYLFRINSETSSVRSLVVTASKNILESALMITGVLVILLILNWRLALLALIAVPFLYISIKHYSPRIEHMSREIQLNAARLYSHTASSVQNIQTVQAFDKTSAQTAALEALLYERYRIGLRNLLLHGKFGMLNDMISTVSIASLILLGGLAVLDQGLSIGELIVFITYVSFLYGPLETINSTIGKAKSDLAAAQRVFEVVNSDNAVKEAAHPIHIGNVKGFINFNNVSFAYRNDQPLLSNVHLHIKPGQKVLLIGPSGSGKTSLLNLLPRFYDPTQGVVHLDGREIRSLSLKDLRRQFSIVTQEPLLVSGTVAENIMFGSSNPRVTADSIDIRSAAEAADAHHFIESLVDRYDTHIGPDGVRLSGGQKQRIAIARAFLKNAPILLLDEPTSALDATSERALIKTLRKLMADRTVLISTHREAFIQEADIVYLVKDGEVAEIYNPEEYMRQQTSSLESENENNSIYYQSMSDTN
jgi:ATP-binding cassette, subfamily B, bacterial